MNFIITGTEKPLTTNTSSPLAMACCTNCIHGDYWINRHAPAEHQTSGFDCCYPSIGLKSPQYIDFDVIGDQSTAAHCPKYQLLDAAN